MFKFKKPYYYGEGTDHIVRLTVEEANAVNKLRVYEVVETPNGTYVRLNLTEQEQRAYNTAVDLLNEYLETHDVFASEEYLQNNDMLRPVKK